MSAYVKQLTQNGDDIYPITKAKAVYMDDKQTIEEYVNGFHYVTTTLLASSWTGSAAPYSYDLSTVSFEGFVVKLNGSEATVDQAEAAANANIEGGTGKVIYAFGDKPTIDIPVICVKI